jgi:hypothetical protein
MVTRIKQRTVSPDLVYGMMLVTRSPETREYLREVGDSLRRAALYENIEDSRSGASGVPAPVARRGQRGVDVAAVWKIAAEKLYKSGDLLALATREAMQNSVDAIRASYRSRGALHVPKGEGYFSVTLRTTGTNAEGRNIGEIVFEDNGIGMDVKTLEEKLMNLGATSKPSGIGEGGEEIPAERGSPASAGGFGMAKAVIFGVSTTDNVEIHTRNTHLITIPGTYDYEVTEGVEPRRGTKITVRDVIIRDEWSHLFESGLNAQTRVKNILAYSDTPDVSLMFNGDMVTPFFSGRRGSKLEFSFPIPWGEGNATEIRGYRRGVGTGSGLLYIRLNGLFQFSERPDGNVALPSDIVLDVETTNKPTKREYPLNASREDWNPNSPSAASYAQIKKNVSNEAASAAQRKQWTTYLPDSSDEREREGAAEFASQFREVAEDPDFVATLNELASGMVDFYEKQKPETQQRSTRGQPAPRDPGTPEPPQGPADPYDNFRSWSGVMPRSTGEAQTEEGRKKLGTVVLDVVRHVAEGGEPAEWAVDLASTLQRGEAITPDDARRLIDAIQVTRERGSRSASGETVAQDTTTLSVILAQLNRMIVASSEVHPAATPETVAKARKRAEDVNPFGAAGAVKVNTETYDKDAARKFMRNAKKYIPMLVLWDMTLRMIAGEGSFGTQKETGRVLKVTIPFKPGFVLDSTVRGLTTSDGDIGTRSFKNFVLLQPDKFEEVIDAFKEKPWAIAGYLHGVASHEVAHLPFMGQGHNEPWAVQREDLGFSTAHLLPAIEQLVVKLLKAFGVKETLSPVHRKRVDAALEAERKQGRTRRVEESAMKYAMQIQRLESEVVLVKSDRDRYRAIVDTMREGWAFAQKLLRAQEYHEFRGFLTSGQGSLFLPPGTSVDQLLLALDTYPKIAADVFLGPRGT